MEPDAEVKHLRELLDEGAKRQKVLRGLDDAARGHFEPPYLPPSGSSAIEREYKALMNRAELPICGLIVKAVVDRLVVEGVRSEDGEQDDTLWDWWQYSNLDTRQSQIYTDSGTFGDGYMSVTLSEDGKPLLLPESPLALYAVHDPMDPLKVLEAVKQVGEYDAYLYTDKDIRHYVKRRNTSTSWELAKPPTEHPLGVCPIVRFPNQLDSLGRSTSEIEIVLPFQRRINQSIFTRLLLEAHTAWRQRWASGIEVEKDPETGEAVPPFQMGVDRIVIAPDIDTKFGEFQASSTEDLLRAVEEDLRQLAVVTQTPPTMFAATSVSNISEESLAALEGGLTRKVETKQQAHGESFEYGMVLAGRLVGHKVGHDIEMLWKNMELRSLSQKADALVKLKQSGLPMEHLLSTILDMTPRAITRVMAQVQAEESMRAVAQATAYGVTGEGAQPIELTDGG